MLRAVPEAKFIIGGDGSQRLELETLVESLGVSSSVRFAGFIPNDQLPQYLASSDVYVSTSLSDGGLAASTAEAMSCELPVVVTDFGDNKEWVKEGINGFLVPLQDYQKLASRIIYLLRNKNDRIKFGQAGRKVIEGRNNFFVEMAKMEQLYKDLIARYK